jgi:hypothetical protein
MFLGDYLVRGHAVETRYTAPFARRGLAALFTAEVTQAVGSPTLSLQIEHKNDNGTWANAGSFSDITTTGVYTKDITGIKQQVRIAAAMTAGPKGDFFVLVFRLAGISWRL